MSCFTLTRGMFARPSSFFCSLSLSSLKSEEQEGKALFHRRQLTQLRGSGTGDLYRLRCEREGEMLVGHQTGNGRGEMTRNLFPRSAQEGSFSLPRLSCYNLQSLPCHLFFSLLSSGLLDISDSFANVPPLSIGVGGRYCPGDIVCQ